MNRSRMFRDQAWSECRAPWLFEGSEPLATAENAHAADLAVHAMVITLTPDAMMRAGEVQDTEENRYSGALGALVAADAGIVVRSYFTTQPIPPALASLPPLYDRRASRA